MYEVIDGRFFLVEPELGLNLSGSPGVSRCTFYEGGELKWEAFYLDDRLHGPSTFFARNGTLLSKSWFYEGQREGRMWQYYLSSRLSSIQRHKGGLLEGSQEYYYEDGQLKTEMFYKNGLLHGTVLLFWPDGSKKREAHFSHGKREGWDRLFNERQELIDEKQYKPEL